jgi:hypothetical protein
MPVLALNEQISCEARLISRSAKTEISTNIIPRNDVPTGLNNRNDGRIVVDIIRDFKVHGILDERYQWELAHANTIVGIPKDGLTATESRRI